MMNDLEFRRAVYEDPNNLGPEAQAVADSSDANRHFVNEIQELDKALAGAMAVEVPPNLADRILLNQTLGEFERRQQRRSRWQLAIAASLAFVVGGLMTFMGLNRSPLGYGGHALAHVYHEAGMLDQVDENVTLAAFNKKLASYGARLTGDIGHIYFANHCDFQGVRGLHAIIQGEQGRITVFVISDKVRTGNEQAHFADHRFDGLAEKLGSHQVIFIGEKGEPLDKFERRFKEQLQRQI
ncbi:DUF3379 family protein [Gallaecimonas sp. GXIMD4217]|uniref:DUF3379 family protein n=1 Tax=Gallaecimonas sp. GXIMD4217 TaxID=3131927 RepID=UPI00311ABDF4